MVSRRTTLRKVRRRRPQRGGELPPESISKLVKHAIFVSLVDDTAKREQIKEQLKMFSPEQMGFAADDGQGAYLLGIADPKHPKLAHAKCHMNVLIKAKEQGWENVLIVEDTAKWSMTGESYSTFEKAISAPYDVILLNKDKPSLAYVVHRNYYSPLILKNAAAIADFIKGRTSDEPSIDKTVFAPLQEKDTWVVIDPPLMISQ